MKKAISLLLALILCLSLCACGGGNNQSNENYIAELEQQIRDMETEMLELNRTIENQDKVFQDLEQQVNEYTQKLDSFEWVISWLEEGEYDAIIRRLEQMQEEERKAEMEAKGIVEITITIDNWDEYFEYVPYSYPYIRNAFGEITHMNCCGGLRLKDGYSMVEDGGTDVKFEMETHMETFVCTIDFTTGSYEFGEVTKVDTNTDTTTAHFSDYYYNSILSFGIIGQLNNDDGNFITKETSIEVITQMLRAEGTLVLYQN